MEKDHLEILLEDINGRFDLVLEGHGALLERMNRLAVESKERDDHLLFLSQTLNTKIDTVERSLNAKLDSVESRLGARIDAVDQKIGTVERSLGAQLAAVTADLSAHRRDTEAHGEGVYRVKEGHKHLARRRA